MFSIGLLDLFANGYTGACGDLSARHELDAMTFKRFADGVMSVCIPREGAILAL